MAQRPRSSKQRTHGMYRFGTYSFISLSEPLNRYIFLYDITVHKCLWMLQGIFHGRPDHESLSRQSSKGELSKRVGGRMQTFSKPGLAPVSVNPLGYLLCPCTAVYSNVKGKWASGRSHQYQQQMLMGIRRVSLMVQEVQPNPSPEFPISQCSHITGKV